MSNSSRMCVICSHFNQQSWSPEEGGRTFQKHYNNQRKIVVWSFAEVFLFFFKHENTPIMNMIRMLTGKWNKTQVCFSSCPLSVVVFLDSEV